MFRLRSITRNPIVEYRIRFLSFLIGDTYTFKRDMESLSEWADAQFPEDEQSLEFLPQILDECRTLEISTRNKVFQ